MVIVPILGQNSTGASSSAEFNRLSGELNSRISSEKDEMINSVSVKIQKPFSDAINNQVKPQLFVSILSEFLTKYAE